MKQHLRIKSFWGTTLNAVKIQMYCVIIAYCLVAIVGNKLKVNCSIYENFNKIKFDISSSINLVG
jgi:hypothetical protein